MYSYNQAINPTEGYTRRQQLDSLENPVLFFNQDNLARMTRVFNFGKFGIDYAINNRNTISLNGMLMGGRFLTLDDQNFEVSDRFANQLAYGTRVNDQFAGFTNYNGQILYKKTYPKAGKELTADINYNFTNSANGYL